MSHLEREVKQVEGPKIAKGRERKVFDVIYPLWLEGKTPADIQSATGCTPMQIHNALGNARNRGILPRPNAEETYQRWYKANEGKPSPKKGQLQSVELTLQAAEGVKAAPLTDLERELIILAAVARRVPIHRERPTLLELYSESNRILKVRTGDKRFLEIFYAVRVCLYDTYLAPLEQEAPVVNSRDMTGIYDQTDPDIYRRRRKDIDFIVSKTLRPHQVFQLV